MLKKLTITNYALIRELAMEPSPDLNIITGETGAGKSIMIGAIGLLLGNRADTKSLLEENQKCIVEGTFDLSSYNLKPFFEKKELDYEEECIIRREIAPSGKSRAFINDTPAVLNDLKELGSNLVDIHSQHDNLLFYFDKFQTDILDAYAGHQELVTTYKQVYQDFKQKEKQLEELRNRATETRKALDYNSYLLNELKEANLESGEQESIEEELNVLENAEQIKTLLAQSTDAVERGEYSVTNLLHPVVDNLEKLSEYSEAYQTLKERAESCMLELRDLAGELESAEQKTEVDPGKTEQLRERLDLIHRLQQKHQVNSADELLNIQEELTQKVDQDSNFEEQLQALEEAKQEAYNKVQDSGKALSESRKQAIPNLQEALENLLSEVGMPEATLRIEQEATEPGERGLENIRFLFSANKGITPRELKKIASGGEFSRLMLCLKYIMAERSAMPTIIFDEIDTGVSGEVAIQVGKMLREMGERHQVIAITHLTQIAAMGSTHYFVYKDSSSDKAVSEIKKLSEEERINELAQMIGGVNPSESAYQNARELLKT